MIGRRPARGRGDRRGVDLAVGPTQIPRIADAHLARRQPELSFLSALAHAESDADPELVRAALAGLGTLDSARTSSYVTVLLHSLSAGLRGALETTIMETPESDAPPPKPVSPELVRRALLWGERMFQEEVERRQSREQGREEGREQGREEGERHARREILARFLARAGLQPTADQQQRIAACEDLATLDLWLERSLDAQDVAQVLA